MIFDAQITIHEITKSEIGSPRNWYPNSMTRETTALLKAFENLPSQEKRAFTEEVLRRSLPFDSGPLEDEEIGAASSALFQMLDEEDGASKAR